MHDECAVVRALAGLFMTRLENSRRRTPSYGKYVGQFSSSVAALLRMPTRLERSSWDSFPIPLGSGRDHAFTHTRHESRRLCCVWPATSSLSSKAWCTPSRRYLTRGHLLSVPAYLSPKRKTFGAVAGNEDSRNQHSSPHSVPAR